MVITPRVDRLKTRYDGDRVLFVELDMSDEHSATQARYMISALGIADIWADQKIITGELLLVDARRHSVLSTLTQQDDVQQMVAAMDRAIDRTSG